MLLEFIYVTLPGSEGMMYKPTRKKIVRTLQIQDISQLVYSLSETSENIINVGFGILDEFKSGMCSFEIDYKAPDLLLKDLREIYKQVELALTSGDVKILTIDYTTNEPNISSRN